MGIIGYSVIDLETSIKNRGEDAVGTMQASPFHPDNKIVMAGIKYVDMAGDDTVFIFHGIEPPPPVAGSLLVGQNIKFDMLYLKRRSEWNEWLAKGNIWDTMIVEYLLSGQVKRYVSLDELAKKYGGTCKPDAIKEYWKAGIDTEDIDAAELEEYLKGDVNNTEIIFKGQLAKAKELGMLSLIESQMGALLATTEMEFNGIHFDIEKAVSLADEVEAELKEAEAELIRLMAKAGIKGPNPGSNEHVSLFLFGGVQTVVEKWKTIKGAGIPPLKEGEFSVKDFDTYGPTAKKAGEFKTKNMSVAYTIPCEIIDPSVFSSVPAKKTGYWSTSEDVLKNIRAHGTLEASTYVKLLLKYRGLLKDLNTYYIGYGKLYWPHDQKIHGSFNHCVTATGRLSSSKPNLQNLSNK